ncbi:TetR/AcrR family transcriptional regulator [Dactylosporangium matsuzakiense]|uniref:TetR family transcriptional regulator n=1 Tax=Dactylosporangium matsuzakiense TaxID=53360 RepID=A0A9W6KRZ0_9ACTN|nr:TetR/AcrR family transcriptional regulator [Dactylosporangium matsuzakiense]UWZ41461.1 TetR family transcriptional regulator [Dactylosporangium matsuzakiense]GLL07022.1 TetR family transcriptional regulator [Dactylosporangium matsuzakiense]
MSDTAVSWLPEGAAGATLGGLRERKKREMRARLSGVATRMFLERGFAEVRVTEIAEACGVSERTVFNYFPTKESLLLDRFDDTLSALRAALANPAAVPLPSTLAVLDAELRGLTGWLGTQPDPAEAAATIRRFRALTTSTPELRAHQHDMVDLLTGTVTGLLAARVGASDDAPEAHIAAVALLGLWRVQGASLQRHLRAGNDPTRVHDLVSADVRAAAATIAPIFERFA